MKKTKKNLKKIPKLDYNTTTIITKILSRQIQLSNPIVDLSIMKLQSNFMKRSSNVLRKWIYHVHVILSLS